MCRDLRRKLLVRNLVHHLDDGSAVVRRVRHGIRQQLGLVVHDERVEHRANIEMRIGEPKK